MGNILGGRRQRALGRRTTSAWLTTFALIVGMVPTFLLPLTAGAAGISIVDDGGANDEVGQNDLTRLTGDDLATTDFFEVSWSWDEPSAITGGGQAVNGCAMFDTDGDGNVNYSFCVEVSEDEEVGSPTFGQLVVSTPPPPDGDTWFPHWVQCGDAKDDRCAAPVVRLGDPVDLPDGLGATTCSVSVTPTDPFDAIAPNGPGDDYPLDITVTCDIDANIIPASAEFINVCSYPSAGNDGNNNPFDCVVTPGSGFLTIVKVADPDDGTAFTFNSSVASNDGDTSWTINGSGTVALLPFATASSGPSAGTATLDLVEVVPNGWNLDSASCAIQTTTPTSTGTSTTTGVDGLVIRTGLETICTFTDSLATGSLKITKTVDAGGSSFTTGSFGVSASCTNDPNSPYTRTISYPTTGDVTITGIPADSVCTVTETSKPTAPAGYSWDTEVITGSPATITSGGTANVTVANKLTLIPVPHLAITKVATEEIYDAVGDVINYTIVATNDGNVTLASVTVSDPKVNGLSCTPANGSSLAPNASMTCTASHTIVQADIDAGHYANTACVDDGAGGAAQVCAEEDVPENALPDVTVLKTGSPSSVPETGGNVVFTYRVTNNSDEAAEITVLSDDKFGTLAGDADCQVGTILAGGAFCEFSATFAIPAGDYPGSHVNVFTGTVTDGDGNNDSDTDDETITYTDVLPDITVTKTGSPTSVLETGGDVTFTFTVKNNSLEDATITALSDDQFGTLAGDADCQVGTVLGYNETCSFEATFSIPAGDYPGSHVNVFTGTVTDGDGNNDSDTDDETITYTDVLPNIEIKKQISVDGGTTWLDADSAPGPYVTQGDTIMFRFIVTNNSLEAATITSLADSVYGTLAGDADCQVDTVLDYNASCSFEITKTATAGQHTNTATVTASDDDGNSDSDSDDANYYGLNRGQPSIQINSLTISIDSTRTTVTGQFNITDESTSAKSPDGFLVAILDYGVRWEQKGSGRNSKFTAVVPSGGCTYTIVSRDGVILNQALAPGEDVIFDETVVIGYTCTFGSTQLTRGGTLRGKAYADIFGRTGMQFTFSSTASIPR